MWENLPDDIIWKILDMADLSIDARVYLGMKPKKIPLDISNDLWMRLTLHDGYVYNTSSKTLHTFVLGLHIIRRPVILSFRTAGFAFLDPEEDYYTAEINHPNGEFYSSIETDRITIRRKILLKE